MHEDKPHASCFCQYCVLSVLCGLYLQLQFKQHVKWHYLHGPRVNPVGDNALFIHREFNIFRFILTCPRCLKNTKAETNQRLSLCSTSGSYCPHQQETIFSNKTFRMKDVCVGSLSSGSWQSKKLGKKSSWKSSCAIVYRMIVKMWP